MGRSRRGGPWSQNLAVATIGRVSVGNGRSTAAGSSELRAQQLRTAGGAARPQVRHRTAAGLTGHVTRYTAAYRSAIGETDLVPDDLNARFDLRDISVILEALLTTWDRAVEIHGQNQVDTSTIYKDMVIGERLGWSENTRRQTGLVTFMIASSVAQMARSVAALYDAAHTYSLTFGHVPLARSIYEGIGQIQWLLADDDELTTGSGAVLSVSESERRCVRRAARAFLTTAANWRQCARDADFQQDAEMKASAVGALKELKQQATEVSAVKTKGGDWQLCEILRPGFREFGERGWQLAWWPNEVVGHPYGYVSAVSHHNLYPIARQLSPAISNGRNVLRVTTPVDEVFSDGVSMAAALYRLIDLVFAYVEWPSADLATIWQGITRAHSLL